MLQIKVTLVNFIEHCHLILSSIYVTQVPSCHCWVPDGSQDLGLTFSLLLTFHCFGCYHWMFNVSWHWTHKSFDTFSHLCQGGCCWVFNGSQHRTHKVFAASFQMFRWSVLNAWCAFKLGMHNFFAIYFSSSWWLLLSAWCISTWDPQILLM